MKIIISFTLFLFSCSSKHGFSVLLKVKEPLKENVVGQEIKVYYSNSDLIKKIKISSSEEYYEMFSQTWSTNLGHEDRVALDTSVFAGYLNFLNGDKDCTVQIGKLERKNLGHIILFEFGRKNLNCK